ncbi:MAG: proteasome subunit beta [Candidatus Asgardarchaeia archaeon]
MSIIKYPPISTITVGIVSADGVILASEKIFSYSGLIISKNTQKVFSVTKNIGIAFAGISADMTFLVNLLKSEISLFELEARRPIGVRASVKLLSRILFSRKFVPYLALSLVGGVDERGPQLFELDIWGSIIPHKRYAAIGFGSEPALGILESKVTENISLEDAENIAIDAIKFSSRRSAGTGYGADILILQNEKPPSYRFYKF